MYRSLNLVDVDKYYDEIMPLLQELVAVDQPDWTAEQALDMCRYGKWLCFMNLEGDRGFAMAAVYTSAFSSDKELVIEAACKPTGSFATTEYASFWNWLAQELGCKCVVMESRRKGWERLGWAPRRTEYVRVIGGTNV